MTGCFFSIKIAGISTCVPEKCIDNFTYEERFGEKRVGKHIKLTGVKTRHVLSGDKKASDLAYSAGEQLLKHLQWDREQINCLIYVTQAPDYDKPATAFILQKRLQIGKDCLVFDVNLGCSGFVAGIQIMSGLLQNCGGRGLLLIADSNCQDERENPVDEMLFGDAGCAVAMEKMENHRILYHHESDGTRFDVIHKEKNGLGVMDGSKVFAFTLNDVADSIKKAYKVFSITDEDVDYYFFHQGQKMILDNLVELCKISSEKVLYSIQEYGNTSGASIPVTICANRELLSVKKQIRSFMCGYGVGLSWGSLYLLLDTKDILPIHLL